MHRTALLKAIQDLGNQTLLAKKIGVNPSCVNKWLRQNKSIPYQYVLAIEEATEGRVTREELAPIMYNPFHALKYIRILFENYNQIISKLIYIHQDLRKQIKKIHILLSQVKR